MADAPAIDERLDRLSRLEPDDREAIRDLDDLAVAEAGGGLSRRPAVPHGSAVRAAAP
jgi:hypothetical protein